MKAPARATPPPSTAPALAAEEPPLTDAPAASPELVVALDMAAILDTATAGTEVKLAASDLAEAWAIPGIDLQRPLVAGGRLAGSASGTPVLASAVGTAARFELGKPDATLPPGLTALRGEYCFLSAAGRPEAMVLCGPRERALAFRAALSPTVQAPTGGALARVRARYGQEIGKSLYELRRSEPGYVDRLIPDGSQLSASKALRRAVHDLAFDAIGKLIDGYEAAGELELEMRQVSPGKLELRTELHPKAGSFLERALGQAEPAHLPRAFWDLPRDTDAAIVVDASLLSPLLEPSPRALSLLAEARPSVPALDAAAALPSVCLRRGRAVLAVDFRAPESEAEPPWPPQLSEKRRPASPARSLLGIEDPDGKCSKALASFAAGYEAAAVPVKPEATAAAPAKESEATLRKLEAPKELGQGALLLQIGKKAPTFVAVSPRAGITWLAWSGKQEALVSALKVILPDPKRKSLKARSELAALGAHGQAPALLLGFSSAQAMLSLPQSGSKADKAAEQDAAKLTIALTRSAAGLELRSPMELSTLRRLLTTGFGGGWTSAGIQRMEERPRSYVLKVLEGMCRLGDGKLCNLLGVIYQDAKGVPKDSARAQALFDLGCKARDGTACTNWAFGAITDPARQIPEFEKGCALAAPLGCAWLGVRLLDNGKPGEQRRAFQKLQEACEGGVGWACARIASHYMEGAGLDVDATRGAEFYERGCQLRSAHGCIGMARAFANGKGRAQNADSAQAYYQEACSLDKAEGCYVFGLARYDGRGVPKDQQQGRKLLETACNAGQAEACRFLAEISEEP